MDTTCNDFLNGRLSIRQPASGYRAGVDAVILAASVPAKAGQSVLELGCGVGTAILCLGARVPDLSLSAVEIQPDMAELAHQNGVANGQNLSVLTADLTALPDDIKQRLFDHVLANPPYFDRNSSTRSARTNREIAMGEQTPLDLWVATAARRLAPGGYASFIHRIERLPELLMAIDGRLGSIQVLPLAPRQGRDPGLVLLRARKGGRAAFRLHAAVVMHDGPRHEKDGENYTPMFTRILREAGEIDFP